MRQLRRALLVAAWGAGLLAGRGTTVRAAAAEGPTEPGTPKISAEAASEISGASGFKVEDYAQVRVFEDLHLSPDGDFVLYTTRHLLRGDSGDDPEVFVLATTEGAKPLRLDLPETARAIRWAGNSHSIAFLADDHNLAQVYLYDREQRKVSRISASADPVVAFELSNSGKALAYVTRPKSEETASLYTSLRRRGPGILIDTDTVNVFEVIDPHFASKVYEPNATLWVSQFGGRPKRIDVPGDPGSYASEMHWSDDDSMISVVYIGDDVAQGSTRLERPSLGVLSVTAGKFHIIAAALDAKGVSAGQIFSGGDWIPGQHRIVVKRRLLKGFWNWDYPEWAVATTQPLDDQRDLRWHAVDSDSEAKIHPITPRHVLVEDSIRAVPSLYEWSNKGVRRSDMVAEFDGTTSKFSFARNNMMVAFVSESMIRPPEIYLYRSGYPRSGVRRLSFVNQQIAAKMTASISEITWTSTDGTTVQGWLLAPATSWAKPWPVVTYLHGGPGGPITNNFAANWARWPYPFDVYAAHGIATFFPNYRGSATFGRTFQKPKQLDGEPIDDVITGVKSLVNAGIADRSRLGLSGHSHGGWLGPMVLTRFPMFRACSFAEGMGNAVEAYELLNGRHLREIIVPFLGADLYDAPGRYLELSPDLHFGKVRSANLFESGSEQGLLEMLGLGKASAASGLPTESVTYPLTGHNPTDPMIQRDTAQRNADWFLFWLRDEERQDSDAASQYGRWRTARTDWRARFEHDPP